MVGQKSELNAQQVVVEASQKISLKVGGNFVVIDAGGVYINGAMVSINSGGPVVPTGDPTIEDPLEAAGAGTCKDSGGSGQGGGGRSRHSRVLHSQHAPEGGQPKAGDGRTAANLTTKAKGPFETEDDAAKAALTIANPQSIRDNLEYSGLIYKGTDGKYYFTGPVKGTDQGANPLKDAPAPPGTQVVADYHTHGDYSTIDPNTGTAVRTNDPSKDQFNSDNFSTQDKRDNQKQGYPGYLGTPSGSFRKYDPITGNDTVL
jgi:hypothetical protein